MVDSSQLTKQKEMKPRSQMGALLAEIHALDPASQHSKSKLPRLIFSEELADLLGLTVTTIRFYTGNAEYHHLLPQFFKINRRLAWTEKSVLDFLEEQKEKSAVNPQKKRGRPSKVELARRASR